eukprot:Gb_20215 [translate_table: standard]
MAGRGAKILFKVQRKLNQLNFAPSKLFSNHNSCGALWLQQARHARSSSAGSAVDNNVLGYLKQQYLEASKMRPPPKIGPPRPFVVIKGALDTNGPVLSRTYNQEDIKISVLRLANIGESGEPEEFDDENINQLFLTVVITKGDNGHALQFLCDLYPDAMGIQSVSLKDVKDISNQTMDLPKGYQGPCFQDLDEKLQQAFRKYLEERGINEDLFRFLQAWLYVKDHRHLMQWLKMVGTLISKQTVPESS